MIHRVIMAWWNGRCDMNVAWGQANGRRCGRPESLIGVVCLRKGAFTVEHEKHPAPNLRQAFTRAHRQVVLKAV